MINSNTNKTVNQLTNLVSFFNGQIIQYKEINLSGTDNTVCLLKPILNAKMFHKITW